MSQNTLIPVNSFKDIPAAYHGTPIGLLLEYHNLNRSYDDYAQARLLVGMCMDNRKHLHMPDNFAYIIRSGGANMRYSEFKISFAISVGGVRHMTLIGHNHCGMVNLAARKDKFIEGLVQGAGWDAQKAEEHFMSFAPMFEIVNEGDFVLGEVKRLRVRYPKIMFAPMLYKVEDGRLYLLNEG